MKFFKNNYTMECALKFLSDVVRRKPSKAEVKKIMDRIMEGTPDYGNR